MSVEQTPMQDVRQGEKLRASTVNALIDQANHSGVQLIDGIAQSSKYGITLQLTELAANTDIAERSYEPLDVDEYTLSVRRGEVLLDDGEYPVRMRDTDGRLGQYYYEIPRKA